MSWRQLQALMTMGLALLRKLLLLPFARSSGSGPWLARLGQEQLAPTPERAWGRFARAGRCIGCGLCDAVVGDGTSPYQRILGAGRRPEDALLVRDEAATLAVQARDIARVCPARVGVAELAALIEDNARALGGR